MKNVVCSERLNVSYQHFASDTIEI